MKWLERRIVLIILIILITIGIIYAIRSYRTLESFIKIYQEKTSNELKNDEIIVK